MAKAFARRLSTGTSQMKAPIISHALEKHTASLIFLHGSGKFQSHIADLP